MFEIKWRNGVAQFHTTSNGRRIRRSLKTSDPEVARRRAIEEAGRIERAALYGADKEATFADACVLYLRLHSPKRNYLTPIIKAIGKERLANITPGSVKTLAKQLYKDVKPQTWNRQVLKPVRAVINCAHEHGLCGAMKMNGFPEKNKKDRRAIERGWIDSFMYWAIKENLPRLAAYALFMFTTGARPNEAVRLSPHHLDLDNKRAYIEVTKNGDGRTFFLTKEMVEVLRNLPPRQIQWGKFKGEWRIFGWADAKGPLKPWKKICALANITPVLPYEGGRHSFATEAVTRQERNVVSAAKVGGWKDPTVLMKHYAHPEQLGEFAEEVFGKPTGAPVAHDWRKKPKIVGGSDS